MTIPTPPNMTAEDHAKLDAFQRAITRESAIAAEEMKKKAAYKIQIWFKSNRSSHGNVAFSLSAWESGKRLHGGGDEMMFICHRQKGAPKVTPFDVAAPNAKRKATPRGCGGLIPGGTVHHSGTVVCLHCHMKHDTEHIGDSIFYNCSMHNAAEVLTKWWLHLAGNADIYVKYSPQDPRTVMMSREYSARVAREKKGLTIYPLCNIIADTAAGADLTLRFKALLLA